MFLAAVLLVPWQDAMINSGSPALSVAQLGARWLLLAVLPRPEQTVILVFSPANTSSAATPPPV